MMKSADFYGAIPGIIALTLGVANALWGWPIVLAWIFVGIYAVAQFLLMADLRRRMVDQAQAWDDGFTACAHQHMEQYRNPCHPITRINPYGSEQ